MPSPSRSFSSSSSEESDSLDSIDSPYEDNKVKQDRLLVLPIPRHPIWPKNIVRFRLTIDAFNFMINEETSDYIAAFVSKETEFKNELENYNQFNSSVIPHYKGKEGLHNVGAYCKTIFNRIERTIVLKPINRIRLLEVEPNPSTLYPYAKVEHIEDKEPLIMTEDDKAMQVLLLQKIEAITNMLKTSSEVGILENTALRFNMRYNRDLLNFAGIILSYFVSSDKIQTAFEIDSFSERMKRIVELAQEFIDRKESFQSLQDEAQAKLKKQSDEIKYKEIMTIIKQKLGLEKDEKEVLKRQYEKNLSGKKVPEHVQKIYAEELERLMQTEKNSSEFQVIRTYLDWITCLPYGIYTEETLELKRAREILDRDHYGLNDVKNRILEFIAVSKLRGTSTGKILCFSGPPGVGKTSIAKSIAEALNRKFHRISLGGMDDVSELKGHRRTYLGSRPGKIISALKSVGSENPVILIDEIDKIGSTSRGSPESILLEILDPQQNSSFSDHYLDTTVDLSKVLFLCTANETYNISRPLRDRMEIVDVEGYTTEEKAKIFENYLYPKAIQETSLDQHLSRFSFTPDIKSLLIEDYCREAGVRDLQKMLNKILEKVAVKVVNGEESHITPETLKDYAGYPIYYEKKYYDQTPPGVVMGLSTSSIGGSVLYLEVSKATFNDTPEKAPTIKLTGNLKDVIKESVQIAYSYARNYAGSIGNTYLDKTSIHIHFPSGSTPKDGPSAGIAITTAFLSLALDKPVLPHLAMTGEISLNGKVLKIGGLKDKIVGAKREGIKTVCIPESNRSDWQELSETLREGIQVHFITDYPQIFAVAFPDFVAAPSS